MRYVELLEASRRPFYDPSAIWLHGGPSALEGDALKRYGKSHGDMGALFFCKDVPVGRWYAATYAGTEGRVWTVRLSAPVDTVLDITNPRHRLRLQKALAPEEYANIINTKGTSGHMDWTAVDDEMLNPLGFRGCVFQERPAGMETGLPSQFGMATLPEPVLSVGVFHATDVHMLGFVPEDQVWNLSRK
jgi:hypothetical protein